jgi:valyl-tRNA synthetase
LAGIDELRLDPDAQRTPGSASRVVGEMQIFVHDVIDDDAELARQEKALATVEGQLAACEKTLNNPKFLERAPAEVVQEQRERLAGYQASREAIVAAMKELKG